MAARDGKVSRFDIVSVVIASLSLAVSGYFGYQANKISNEAREISYKAWTRPFPADPTSIPTFGKSGGAELIDAGEGGRKFFEFLDKYSGRKVRIIAWLLSGGNESDDVRVKAEGTRLEIPFKCKDCDAYGLHIRGTGEDKPGLWWRSGWVLEGYFANNGKVSHRMGWAEYEIYAMDIVTAVS
jgi:hypothetical protein